jgi:hypothetical protein
MTNEELRDALIKLAKRTGFSVTEIDYMAQIIAQADYDPLPPGIWGEPFEFVRPKVSLVEGDDFLCINLEVPEPNAQVDFRIAQREFERDIHSMNSAYESQGELILHSSMLVILNTWDWLRFWAVRHPDPQSRARYAAMARECITDAMDLRLRANEHHRAELDKRLRAAGVLFIDKPKKGAE